MKKLSVYLIAISGLLAACDEIPLEKTRERAGEFVCETPDIAAPATVKRKVLIEDFTGMKCGNCPDAAVKAKNLHDQYPDQAVVMGIHCGSFAVPNVFAPFLYDFRTKAGDKLDETFLASATGLPQGMMNRKVYGTSKLLTIASWDAAFAQFAAEPVLASLKIVSESGDSIPTGTHCVHVRTEFLKDQNRKCNLAVYITEDSIVKPQKDYDLPVKDQDIPNYVHMHVLRSDLAGAFGIEIASGAIQTNKVIVKSFSYKPSTEFVLKNLNIVAVLLDAETNEVLQVEEAELE